MDARSEYKIYSTREWAESMKKFAARTILREFVSGILIACSLLIPCALFNNYLLYERASDFYHAANITFMAVESLLSTAAIYYFAWRIRVLIDQRQ